MKLNDLKVLMTKDKGTYTLHELYKLAYGELCYMEISRKPYVGIVYVFAKLCEKGVISREEMMEVNNHFLLQKPSAHSHELFTSTCAGAGHVEIKRTNIEDSVETMRWDRMKYLKKLVSKTNPDKNVAKGERPLWQLYELTLHYFNINAEYTKSYTGICYTFTFMLKLGKISEIEKHMLETHFMSQKPNLNLHTDFLIHEYYTGGETLWWKVMGWEVNGVTNERKRFLTKMISLTKDYE
jgi:hypothetical protein